VTYNDLVALDCLTKILETVTTKTTIIGLYARRIKKNFSSADDINLILEECDNLLKDIKDLVESERCEILS
jgi:hypothetical protein